MSDKKNTKSLDVDLDLIEKAREALSINIGGKTKKQPVIFPWHLKVGSFKPTQVVRESLNDFIRIKENCKELDDMIDILTEIKQSQIQIGETQQQLLKMMEELKCETKTHPQP